MITLWLRSLHVYNPQVWHIGFLKQLNAIVRFLIKIRTYQQQIFAGEKGVF
jgi:hypothetical protein